MMMMMWLRFLKRSIDKGFYKQRLVTKLRFDPTVFITNAHTVTQKHFKMTESSKQVLTGHRRFSLGLHYS